MKKRTLSLLLCLVMCLSLMPMSALADGLSVLNANISTGGILSWDTLEGAASYYWNIGKGEKSCGGNAETTSIDLNSKCESYGFSAGDYDVTLYARNSSNMRISEEWKGTFHYNSTQETLDAPTSLRVEDSICKWNAVTNATSYIVAFQDADGRSYGSATVNDSQYAIDPYNISLVDGQDYKFMVKASAAGYVDSEYSESALFTYSKPSTTVTLQNVTISGGILSWDALEGAASYYWNIGKGAKSCGGNAETTSIDLNSKCESYDFAAGDYEVTLYARNSSNTQISEEWKGTFHYDPSVSITFYDVWVDGRQVTSANKDNVLGNGKVSYDPDINILTVSYGANITGTHEDALIYAENMDLTVYGDVTLTAAAKIGIYVKGGSLTVNGDVTLTAAAEKGIYVREGSLTVNGSYTAEAAYPGNIAAWATGSITVTGDVTVKNYGYGLEADSGKITVGGHVTAEAFAVALCTEVGDISVGEAVDITLVGDGNGDTFGIRANGAVEITGGAAITGNNGRVAVNAKAIELGGDAEISGFAIGLYASDGDIAVKGDADITINSENENAITAQNGNVTIDGNATINGKGDCAIYANKDLAVGKDVTVTGNFNHGLRASNGKVTMESGKWDITASCDAIEAKTSIVIPATHKITLPDGGKIGQDASNPGYAAVSESDGTTVAKQAVIEPVFTVSFDMNGHGDQLTELTVKEGEMASKPADPTAEGWTFDGWYADATCSVAFDFNSAITANTTVYAKWTPVHTHNYTSVVTNPTCTEKGYTTHTCACGDSYVDTYITATGHTYGGWTTIKEPTLTEKGMKERSCTVCGDKQTEEIPVLTPATYSIISGANGEWTKGSSDGLAFTSDADFAKFVCVKVDGAEIAATNYTAVSGSTKVTLNAAYLETLSEGSHSFEIVSNDGSASANFTVKAAENPAPTDPTNPTSPQTGDNSHMFLWIALLFVSSSALVGTAVYGKRRKRAE